VFLLCFGVTAYLTVDTVVEYQANPLDHTVEDYGRVVENIFPAGTLTGTMIFQNNAIEETTM